MNVFEAAIRKFELPAIPVDHASVVEAEETIPQPSSNPLHDRIRVDQTEDILFVPDMSAVREEDCVSCAAYLNGWCLAAKQHTQYNIKYLKACPLEAK